MTWSRKQRGPRSPGRWSISTAGDRRRAPTRMAQALRSAAYGPALWKVLEGPVRRVLGAEAIRLVSLAELAGRDGVEGSHVEAIVPYKSGGSPLAQAMDADDVVGALVIDFPVGARLTWSDVYFIQAVGSLLEQAAEQSFRREVRRRRSSLGRRTRSRPRRRGRRATALRRLNQHVVTISG